MDSTSMTNNKTIQILLPIFNEAENLPSLVEKIKSVQEQNDINISIVFVNDGSTDSTDEEVQKVFDPSSMKYHKFDKNRGYSAAIKKGIELCNSNGYILLFDSDNQFDFSEINLFLDYIDNYDIVIGRRNPRADNFSRVVLGKIWTLIGKLFFRTKIDDLNCGFKIFKSSILKNIKIVSNGPGINLDIFSNPKIKASEIKQINVSHFARLNGAATGSSLKTIMNSFVDLFRITLSFFFSNK